MAARWRWKKLLARCKQVRVEGEVDLGLRMYVLVDESILPKGGAKSAQVAHAVAEMMRLHYPSNPQVKQWAEADRTLLILGADGAEMTRLMTGFGEMGREAVGFWEPDLGQRLTAAAFEPVAGDEQVVFAHLPLAR